jgi:hypothetical protein
LKEHYRKRSSLTTGQERYLESLLKKFSEGERDKFIEWKYDWETNEHIRERGDIISKYYIAQGNYFLQIARVVQDNLKGITDQVPDFYQFHRMTLNEYAEKVWKSHTAPLRWNVGELVMVRSAAKIEGWTYELRAEGVELKTHPCMVVEVNSSPISNTAAWDEKRGGCRWVSVNPIGTNHTFSVMERDLKNYRVPKKRKKK